VAKAIRVHETGGPEVMKLEEVPAPERGADEALVRVEAIGVNFIDINHRSGAYPVPLPFTPGSEGAGVVQACGAGGGAQVGDRVAFTRAPGAYAEEVAVPTDALIPIPDGVGTDVAAAVMLQGMTAHYLLNSVCTLKRPDWVVIHSAAGGVGLLFIQMAKLMGLRVIGLASNEDKVRRAVAAGADHALVYPDDGFATTVRELTGGVGARAVFDAVGKDTFEASLDCLAPRGHMVLFGQASGPPGAMDPRRLMAGSLFLTRPFLKDYTATREELLWRGREVLQMVERERLEAHVHDRYALADAPEAHRQIQARSTIGKSLLIP
jgi:NADPH2:quinone reductase